MTVIFPELSPKSSSKRSYSLRIVRLVAIVGSACLLATTFVTDKNVGLIQSAVIHRNVNDVTSASLSVSVSHSHSASSDGLRYQSPHKSQAQSQAENTSEGPRIVWLASFPNSGTSYTGQLVKHLTKTRTASNYGEQNLNSNGTSVPVFDNDWNGPFYVDPSATKDYTNPPKYVLTKTHCGGYRTNSAPEQYVESTHSFRRRCFGTKYKHNQHGQGNSNENNRSNDIENPVLRGEYNASRLAKAIHLMRNPIDNVVSRFNFEQKRLHAKDSRITKDRKGFRTFCRQMDDAWTDSEQKSIVFNWNDDATMQSLVETIPCHSDFFRYIEWHNLAFVTIQDLGIDTMVLHYEDYTTQFNQTAHRILDFLQLQPVGIVKPFVTGKEYSEDYFTTQERDAVKQLLEHLALRVTWNNLARYFSSVSDSE